MLADPAPSRRLIWHRLREAKLAALPPGGSLVPIYDLTLYLMSGLLCVGFVLAVAVRPLVVRRR